MGKNICIQKWIPFGTPWYNFQSYRDKIEHIFETYVTISYTILKSYKTL